MDKLVEAEHTKKVNLSYDPMLHKILDKDQEAIKEAKQLVKDLREFDRGLAGCSGGKVYQDHEHIIKVIFCILAHAGEIDFVRGNSK